MPMIPEAAFAMFACMRIGAIHSVVFGGFSPEAIKSRILDSDCQFVITADEGTRGGKIIPLKSSVDIALAQCPNVKKCVVVKYTNGTVDWTDDRDIWYEDLVANQPTICECEPMDAEDPSFILYTSGSTGKSNEVLHTTGGYPLPETPPSELILDYGADSAYK